MWFAARSNICTKLKCLGLKGQCHAIFDSVFFIKQLLLVPLNCRERISIFFKFLMSYSCCDRLPRVFTNGELRLLSVFTTAELWLPSICITGNRDSLVMNTLGSLYSLVFVSPESFFVNLFWCLFKIPQEVDSRCIHHRGVDTPQCIHRRVIETPPCIHHEESFGTLGSRLTVFKEHPTIFKGNDILKLTVRYLSYLRSCDLCLKKWPYPKDSTWLPGVFITASQLQIQLTWQLFRKVWNRFWTWLFGLGDVVWRKNWSQKYHDTAPLANDKKFLANSRQCPFKN
jgi:hypothetical protein